MFEHRDEPLLPAALFRRRLARHSAYAGSIVGGSLVAGTAGFSAFAHQAPIDAFLNAAMLLGGMGPVGTIESTPGKLFAAVFALYAGLVFLAAGAIILAPPLHRLLHRFHFEQAQHRRGTSTPGQDGNRT
jgi:hypothetical protein